MSRRFDVLKEIERLDPERDHQRIVHLSFGYDFPWDAVRSLEIALFRTYCVPTISALLDRTGEFRERTQQRYDDTSLRGCVVRWLPPRREPYFFTDSPNRTYPRGYRISELGPPRLVAAERRRAQEAP